MGFISRGKERIERLLLTPGQELGRWTKFLRFQLRLWRFCLRRLWEHNVGALSAALSFRTIFALIPVLVLAFLGLKSLGALEDSKLALRNLLDESGFGQIAVIDGSDDTLGTGEDGAHTEGESESSFAAQGDDSDAGEEKEPRVINVADEIEAMVQKVEAKLTFGRIGPIGIILLIWTALTLLTTIERSLNRVFEAPRHRSLLRRMPLYWSVLTLGPLIVIAALYAGHSLAEEFEGLPGAGGLLTLTKRLETFLIGVLLVAITYKVLPNTRVRHRAAVGGALVAVPLWMLAKWGFSLYLTHAVGGGSLYGALGLVPLFLIWLNLSWSVFLFGAELACTAASLSAIENSACVEHGHVESSDLLACALTVAGAFQMGKGPVRASDVADRMQCSYGFTQAVLDRLTEIGVIIRAGDDSSNTYTIARPPDRITVLELLGAEMDDPDPDEQRQPYAPDVAAAVQETWGRARAGLGDLTLANALVEAPVARPAALTESRPRSAG